MQTLLRYLSDAYATECDGRVVAVRPSSDGGVEAILSETVFHPAGGGQPADTGRMTVGRDTYLVTDVRQDEEGEVWHALDDDRGPDVGAQLSATIDWGRRLKLMRTHSGTHVAIAEAAKHWNAPVTGCDMGLLEARIDFAELPAGISAELEQYINTALGRCAPIHYEFLSRDAASRDPDLVRTKTNLIPDHVDVVRVVVIEGIDRQADGGTHVGNTAEIGHISILKVENKGRGLRRVRLAVDDE